MDDHYPSVISEEERRARRAQRAAARRKKQGQGNRRGKLAVFREISGKGQKEDFQPFLRAETYSDRFLSRWLAGNRFSQKKRLPP